MAYDKNRTVQFSTVGELIDLLKTCPQDAKITIVGDSYCYFHVEEDNSVVNLDWEDLTTTAIFLDLDNF